MEKRVILGMMYLAISDFLFCLVTIFNTFFTRISMVHSGRDLNYVVTMYGEFLVNIIIKMSTWCTVVMALGRHLAVNYPIQAQRYMTPRFHLAVLGINTLFWTILHLPLLWTWSVSTVFCNDVHTKSILLLTFGPFMENKHFRVTFACIWGILGFALPVILLAYYNYKLIVSLRLSRMLQRNYITMRNSQSYELQRRTTITLVAIVCMFFICVVPSEILHLSEKSLEQFSYTTAMTICNLLQVINFSGNFALYCIVNPYFRNAVKDLIPWHWDSNSSRYTLTASARI